MGIHIMTIHIRHNRLALLGNSMATGKLQVTLALLSTSMAMGKLQVTLALCINKRWILAMVSPTSMEIGKSRIPVLHEKRENARFADLCMKNVLALGTSIIWWLWDTSQK